MRSSLGRAFGVALGGCVAFVGYAALATAPRTSAAASSTWSWQNPLPRAYSVTAIACRSVTACVAVGDAIISTNDGGQHWAERRSGARISFQSITCPDRAICYALGSQPAGSNPPGQAPNFAWMMFRSGDGGSTWQQLSSRLPTGTAQFLNDLVCPSVTTCLAGGSNYTTQGKNPLLRTTDSGRTWRAVNLSGSNYSVAVTCATRTVCYVRLDSSYRSRLARSDDAGKTWRFEGFDAPQGGGDPHDALACPAATTCFTVAPKSIEVTRDSGRTWKPVYAGTVFTIACPRTTTCYASRNHSVVSTVDSGKTWTVHRLRDQGLRLACPDPATCYMTTLVAMLKTSDGFGHTQELLAHSVVRNQTLTNISCPTTDSCYIAGSRNACPSGGECHQVPASFVATSDGGSTWRVTTKTPDLLERLSCPRANVCLAINAADQGPIAVDRSDDGTQTWHQIRWQKISNRIFGNNQAADITCVGGTTCYLLATVSEGVPGTNDFATRIAVLVTHDTGQTWSVQTGIDAAAQAGETNIAIVPGRISCPSVTTCFVLATVHSFAGGLDKVIVLSTTDAGKTWTRHRTVPGTVPSGFGPQGLSCPSTTICYLLSFTPNPEAGNPSPGPVLVTRDAGDTWQPSVVSKGDYLFAISCATTQSCRVVGVQAGPISSSGIFSTDDGGATWQRELMADGSPTPPMVSITCPAADTCYSVGGVIILATHPRSTTPSVDHRVIRLTQHR